MGSDSLHRLQGFKPEADAQNHCTDTAYSGPPKAAVRLTAQGGQILIRRVDLCRMSQAVGPVSKTTNVWARVLISADLCRMSQAVGASADAKQRNRRARELRHPKNFIKVHKRAKSRKLAETSACFVVYKLYRFIKKSCSGSNTMCFDRF